MPDADKAQLILMRHAKSDWSDAAAADFDRPLAARGRKAAPKTGKWLRKQGYGPEALLSSPARRARETAVLVGAALKIPEQQIIWDPRIYEAGTGDLLAVIRDHAARVRKLLLIGHNPGLDQLLLHLCRNAPGPDAKGRLLTTGAVAVLTFPGKIRPESGSARLEILRRPRDR